jgi:putative ABC transport system ATP-binding protein
MLELRHISRSFRQGDVVVDVLRDLSLNVETGSTLAIIGRSGSGKSTLLSIMSCMDRPSEGSVFLNGTETTTMEEKELSLLRNKEISIVFQSFELVPSFTAIENVMLPLDIRGSTDARSRAEEALRDVGLGHRLRHLPSELSGGEQQRVAIARALAQDAPLLFADEPTGNLDRRTGEEIIDLLLRGVRERKKTLVLVTHDLALATRLDRTVTLEGGNIAEGTARV